MANKAKFDRNEVVEKATNLYWEKGFNGTSMRNLQDAIDLRPGSIYATFGSKEGLFKESLSHYAQLGIERLHFCQQRSNSVLEGLTLFTHQLVVDTQKNSPSGMCMLQKTVAELTDEQSDLLSFAQSLLQNMEQQIAQLIERAKEQDEVPADKDSKQLARHLQVQILGLRNYARVNRGQLSKKELSNMVDAVFQQAPFK
ncbi:TetR/AcrR family transcriptional regulator [Vibrio sp. FNV 38]|nr:TetR/AcrR family transcriptional regulator [Vibrio sp. FNV 38]